jgi:hypothetical protein
VTALYVSIAVAVVLFALLYFAGTGQASEDSGRNSAHFDAYPRFCSEEIVDRIFSVGDYHFIRELNSPRLQRIYRRERKTIARHWLHQVSVGVRSILRDHLRVSRRSQNLEIAGEFGILFLYLELRCLCGLIGVSLLLVQPGTLQTLATRASGLFHRLNGMRFADPVPEFSFSDSGPSS